MVVKRKLSRPQSTQSQKSDEMSDNSDCDNNKPANCASSHEGREMKREILPIHIDQLFALVFTNSNFIFDFHEKRKTTNLNINPWTSNGIHNSQTRIVTQTMALRSSIGPKTTDVTETQTMLPCSKSGKLYAIDIDSVNAGVPYADKFYLFVHYCLKKVSEFETEILIISQVKYNKSVMGFLKGMIEKNCYAGLQDYINDLVKSLEPEYKIPKKSKRNRKKSMRISTDDGLNDTASNSPFKIQNNCFKYMLWLIVLLGILNFGLLMTYWNIEEKFDQLINSSMQEKNAPNANIPLHDIKWSNDLEKLIFLLRQVEGFLKKLQFSNTELSN